MINVRNAQTYINRRGTALGNDFKKEIEKRAKALQIKMQKDLNESVDKGPVPFTKRAIGFKKYNNGNTSVKCVIFVYPQQTKYLYNIIVKPKYYEKIIPNTFARLNKMGNITGLQSNLKSGKFIVVKAKNGKERLIDTRKKKKRVIGLREGKRRKIIYDFYKEGDKGVRAIISGIKGHFKISRG